MFSAFQYHQWRERTFMPKRTHLLRLGIAVDGSSPVPLHRQLYERLRASVLSGQLQAGSRLPSTRSLAQELGIARNTVTTAYDQLLAEGYIESRVGHGTNVVPLLPEHLMNVVPARPAPLSEVSAHPMLSQRGKLIASMPFPFESRSHFEDTPPFRAGVPALDAFPFALWSQLVLRHTRASFPARGPYQQSSGYSPLREAIAAHIGVTRGVRCSAAQVLIVSGSQQALDLAARLLLDPGDEAWIEDPGYPGTRNALEAAGAHLVPVPIEAEGISVSQGRALSPNARLVSTTPSHQFPLGMMMSLPRRLELLEWARQSDAWILEDDYDSEYRFIGRPLSALQGLDSAQRVLYIGTFSKVLFPSLRLGFLVVPPDLVNAFANALRTTTYHRALLEQMVLADFISEGHFVRHLRAMRTLYAQRASSFVRIAHEELGALMEINMPHTGLHIVGWLRPGVDDRLVARKAHAQGVEVLPLSIFAQAPLVHGGLLFGYATFEEAPKRSGLRHLASILREG
jgi:GntR family transcriptional regulator/MocR family aminotransferase